MCPKCCLETDGCRLKECEDPSICPELFGQDGKCINQNLDK